MGAYEKTIKSDERAIFELRSLFQKYGYTQYKMSKFEEYDLYVKNKEFLVSGEVITFTDTTGKLMALKPDVTLSIIKNSKDVPGAIQKVYYNENVYRVSKGSSGFKEIMQTGLECIGDTGAYEICETLLLALKSLETLSGSFVLDISFIDILSSLLDSIDLPDEKKAALTYAIEQKNTGEVKKICEECAVGEKEKNSLNGIASVYGSIDKVLPELENICINDKMKKACGVFFEICRQMQKSGYEKHINIDFSIVNDMKYYNGVVFKGYIEGVPASVLSGGQYDKMMRRMGRRANAVGFAVYLDMLQRLGEQKEKFDVDTVLIYTKDAKTGDIAQAVEKLTETGSVLAEKTLPENIKYKRLMKLSGKELTEIK